MPLLTYEDAAGWAATIREQVESKRMPPWYADPKFGHFSNDRSLSKDDRETLLKWIDQGCAKGDERDLPATRSFPEGWRIGKPDLILTMEQEFEVPAEMPRGGVPYKYFVVEPKFKEDVWVERAEAKAGATDVVHHIIAFIVPNSRKTPKAAPGPPLLPFVNNADVLCGTAPGDMPLILKPGYARRIPAGAAIVFQMHYTPNGKDRKDRSSIGLILAKEKPKREVLTTPVFNERFRIPPGEANYKVESRFTFKEDAHVLSFMPHMHLRGKDFLIENIAPNGTPETLLSIPRYNFDWQNVYRYAEPLAVKKGDTVHCLGHFDNSPGNPNNPDPKASVRWGDQTWQEMFIGWMDFVYDREPN
jgi:hypothetical protein